MMRCAIFLLIVATMAAEPLPAVDKPVKVFILAGQSNMEGKAPNALLDHQATDPKTALPLTPMPAPTGPQPPAAVAPFAAKTARMHQEAWAKHLGLKVETTNSLGATMILIPPGEFLMGSTAEQVESALKEAERIKVDQTIQDRIPNTERPQHRVVITKPLLMGATEVTIGQFKKFSATGYKTQAEQHGVALKRARTTYLDPGFAVTDDSPAAVISWNDAMAYCKWLSQQEQAVYRLPTEAEWEYACRAGTTTQYSFGDDTAMLDQYGWYDKNADGRPHPVGTKLPNAFGLHDMHGNLYEWCGDFSEDKWYEKSPLTDPSGPIAGSARIFRGGAWHLYPSVCRSAYRNEHPASTCHNRYGFRLVRVL